MPFETDFPDTEPSRAEIDAMTGPVLVEFGAAWCPHCQAIQPRLREALAGHSEVRHIKVADGKGKRLGRSFRVKIWPNLVFLRDGAILKQLARPDEGELDAAFAELSSAER